MQALLHCAINRNCVQADVVPKPASVWPARKTPRAERAVLNAGIAPWKTCTAMKTNVLNCRLANRETPNPAATAASEPANRTMNGGNARTKGNAAREMLSHAAIAEPGHAARFAHGPIVQMKASAKSEPPEIAETAAPRHVNLIVRGRLALEKAHANPAQIRYAASAELENVIPIALGVNA